MQALLVRLRQAALAEQHIAGGLYHSKCASVCNCWLLTPMQQLLCGFARNGWAVSIHLQHHCHQNTSLIVEGLVTCCQLLQSLKLSS